MHIVAKTKAEVEEDERRVVVGSQSQRQQYFWRGEGGEYRTAVLYSLREVERKRKGALMAKETLTNLEKFAGAAAAAERWGNLD